MYKYYKTIQNLIDCELASKDELIQACASQVLKSGKEFTEPTYIKQNTVDYREIVDIGSKDYKFYLEVERQVYKEKQKKVI